MAFRISTDGKTYSEQTYSREEVRAKAEEIAAGKNYGWRSESHGSGVMECVCDYEVILRITPAA